MSYKASLSKFIALKAFLRAEWLVKLVYSIFLKTFISKVSNLRRYIDLFMHKFQ